MVRDAAAGGAGHGAGVLIARRGRLPAASACPSSPPLGGLAVRRVSPHFRNGRTAPSALTPSRRARWRSRPCRCCARSPLSPSRILHVAQGAGVFVGRPGEAPYPWLKFLPWDASVDIFFVISGFVMVYASARLFGRPGAFGCSPAGALARILPLYWCCDDRSCSRSRWPCLGALSEPLGGGIGYILASYLSHSMARPDGFIQPIFRLGWTLNYELLFYSTFAAVRRAASAIGRRLRVRGHRRAGSGGIDCCARPTRSSSSGPIRSSSNSWPGCSSRCCCWRMCGSARRRACAGGDRRAACCSWRAGRTGRGASSPTASPRPCSLLSGALGRPRRARAIAGRCGSASCSAMRPTRSIWSTRFRCAHAASCGTAALDGDGGHCVLRRRHRDIRLRGGGGVHLRVEMPLTRAVRRACGFEAGFCGPGPSAIAAPPSGDPMTDDLPNHLALLPAGLRDLLPPEAETEAAAVEAADGRVRRARLPARQAAADRVRGQPARRLRRRRRRADVPAHGPG